MKKPGLPGFFISAISHSCLFHRILYANPSLLFNDMWLLDQWAERHIAEAQRKDEFENLPGAGHPLVLDDDSSVPAELRTAFRLLKNAGCLPTELQQRKETLELNDLLNSINQEHPDYQAISKKLMLLELKLREAGLNTDFLHGEYAVKLHHKVEE